MKHILYTLTFAAAVLTVACSSDTTETGGGTAEWGELRIAVAASPQVESQTRATVELPAAVIPDGDAFALRITGTYNDDMGNPQPYDQSWATVGAFDAPKMRRGDYTAAITYGDPEAEGTKAACFAGTADFTILARRTVTASIAATLRNAAFRLTMGEWFKKYYTDALLTIRTESGNSFVFSPSTQDVIFVKPGTRLFMQGTAVKAQTGVQVEFPEHEIGTTVACTLHTVAVDASEAGSGKLVIDLDDTFTEIGEQVIELNPEA